MNESIRGRKIVGAAIATPLDDSGDINTPSLVTHARHLLSRGATSIAIFGTTGEGSAFDSASRLRAIESMAKAGIVRASLGTGAFEQSSRSAAVYLNEAFALGCGYALLTPPFYFKDPSDEGLYRWFADVLELTGDSDGEFVLYHIPQVSMVPLSSNLIRRLADSYPQKIVAVKDSAGDIERSFALLDDCPDISVLIGHEGQVAAGVRAGAMGSICALANVVPEAMAVIIETGNDDPRVAELIEFAASKFLIGAVKALIAADSGDDRWNEVAPPLDALDEADRRAVVDCYRRLFS